MDRGGGGGFPTAATVVRESFLEKYKLVPLLTIQKKSRKPQFSALGEKQMESRLEEPCLKETRAIFDQAEEEMGRGAKNGQSLDVC